MSKLCKLSKNPHVNLNRLRKSIVQNDHMAVQFLWSHVDIVHYAPDLLEIAAQYSDQQIVTKLLGYVEINSQKFYDAFDAVVSPPINPYWRDVFPLFLEIASHKFKASFLLNYLILAQRLQPDVVVMVADNLKDKAHADLFTLLAKKSAENNRMDALQSIWPYCTPKVFFSQHPLSVWCTEKSDTFEFLSDEFAKVQKHVLQKYVHMNHPRSKRKM